VQELTTLKLIASWKGGELKLMQSSLKTGLSGQPAVFRRSNWDGRPAKPDLSLDD